MEPFLLLRKEEGSESWSVLRFNEGSLSNFESDFLE